MKIKILFLLTAISVNLLAQNNFTTTKTSLCSIKYPDIWTLDTSGTYGVSLLVLSPLDSADVFRENINIATENIKESILDLDQYAKLSLTNIEKYFTGFKLIENTKSQNINGKYYKIIYTAKQGIYLLQLQQLIFIKNDVAYILTYTAEASKFNAYKDLANEILNSVILY